MLFIPWYSMRSLGRGQAHQLFISTATYSTHQMCAHARYRAATVTVFDPEDRPVRCCEKLWGRILSCGPISNRPSCDIVRAVRGRLKIGLQDEILPHNELGGSTKTAPSWSGLRRCRPLHDCRGSVTFVSILEFFTAS